MLEESEDDIGRIRNSRKLAEELLLEMPDMKDAIALELNLDATPPVTDGQEVAEGRSSSVAVAEEEQDQHQYTAETDDAKDPLAVRRLGKRAVDITDTQTKLSKKFKVDMATPSRKSIIEIRLTRESELLRAAEVGRDGDSQQQLQLKQEFDVPEKEVVVKAEMAAGKSSVAANELKREIKAEPRDDPADGAAHCPQAMLVEAQIKTEHVVKDEQEKEKEKGKAELDDVVDKVDDSSDTTTTDTHATVATSNEGDTQMPDAEESSSSSNNNAGTGSSLTSLRLTAEELLLDRDYRAQCTSFLQHLPCFKLQQRRLEGEEVVPKCRECRHVSPSGKPKAEGGDVYCRFFEFRRLQYNASGMLLVAGFPNPYTDPTRADLNIWEPDDATAPTAGYMDVQVCRYILLHAGDQFCYLWRQESDALKLHENPNTTIAWKKVVQGVREICDVCDTTVFNFHWTCAKCGFSVCADCVKDRKANRTCRKIQEKTQRGRDEYQWLLCTDGVAGGVTHYHKHELGALMLTQIIAGDALNTLGRLMHKVRILWQVPQMCDCLLSRQQLPTSRGLNELIEDMMKESELKLRTSASSLATEETLRKQARLEKLHATKVEFARAHGVDYVPGQFRTKQSLGKDPITSAYDSIKHINFLRKGLAGLRRFLPPRSMTLALSSQLAPDVPHEWLCDGKLLRLTNAMQPDNRILFQEVWKCGQPVMISEVSSSLNLDLWRPEAFCRDFGDKPNDLINCLNGNLVPHQPMRHFWEGFQCVKKRLVDASGKPMLLKLKDWPPGDDFAEILPTRYADLMKGLPMPEYTLRTGNLNIASCLPKMFVPPDLGPKMYNAYGSALHPEKGTTNLHLDISDAVNIMVYVGIPQDTDSRPQLAAAQRAIASGGCDFLTRNRAQAPDVMPGALWHIFAARDADKIRDLLNRIIIERGYRLEPDHDPIHDQNWYLDDKLRKRLFEEYGVEGYPIIQCLGDAVFIPAGAPHQVQNLHNCIKVAEDFVSPENITHCYHLTHEFRRLSHSHTNHEDKLQIKNIIYHAIKDCCTILQRALDDRVDSELMRLRRLNGPAVRTYTRKTTKKPPTAADPPNRNE